MNIFEQHAAVRKLLESYKEGLPILDDQAQFCFERPEYRDAWLITQTKYQILAEVVEELEKIFDE